RLSPPSTSLCPPPRPISRHPYPGHLPTPPRPDDALRAANTPRTFRGPAGSVRSGFCLRPRFHVPALLGRRFRGVGSGGGCSGGEPDAARFVGIPEIGKAGPGVAPWPFFVPSQKYTRNRPGSPKPWPPGRKGHIGTRKRRGRPGGACFGDFPQGSIAQVVAPTAGAGKKDATTLDKPTPEGSSKGRNTPYTRGARHACHHLPRLRPSY